jgi:xylulokinase
VFSVHSVAEEGANIQAGHYRGACEGKTWEREAKVTGRLLMGIDVGTYSSKGVLCSPAGEVLAESQREHGLSIPHPGWAEHDADGVWWEDVCAISRALMASAGVSGDDVAAAAVSALGADLVPLNARGRALRPAILYGIDTRSSAEIAELNQRFGPNEMFDLGGTTLSSQSVGPKILWLRRNEPDVYGQTRYLCSASSFLVYRLSGEYVLDYPTASFFVPLFDMRSLSWSGRYADPIVSQIPLPRLAWPGERIGQVTPQAARQTGLRPGTPVTTGTIDALSEAISVGVLEPGDLMMMYGTTTCLLLVLEDPVPSETMWLMPFAFPGRYDLAAGMATTGALTRWFRDCFAQQECAAQASGGPNAYAVLTEEAEDVPPGSSGLVILPYFSGERTPLNDPDARGVIAGLSLAHGRGHLYRAILEATAYGVAHNLEVMCAAGAHPRRAVAVGGGAQSELLLQIVSDVTGIEQNLPAQTIGASYGDAFLAGLAVGLLSPSDLASEWVRIVQRIQPDAGRGEIYKEYYRIYRDLYPHTVGELHALARLGAE